MSSPANIVLSSFIKIDRRKEEPVYLQIVYQFINAVRKNLLEEGDRLPGSRELAKELHVHRKTIIAALTELQQQGWVRTVPNIGTFVKNSELLPEAKSSVSTFQQPPETAQFHFRKEFVLDVPQPEGSRKYFFTDGIPDYRIIKAEELARFYSWELRRRDKTKALSNTTENNSFFREQLSYYLNLTRGFHLSRNFLLPVAGREQVFSILSRLLIKGGDIILVESLSFFLPNMIFNQAGARIKTVPVDEGGMNVDFIQDHFKADEIRFVYINSRCQYPTTVKLSQKRRKQLLDLALRYDFVVIEDDVDFEFSFTGSKEESLFKMDGGKRVIYIGGFAKFLIPGFQTNFLIGPKDFLEEGKKYGNIFGRPDWVMENAMGQIIYQGDIHRYRRKSQKIITERREMFEELLTRYFVDRISFSLPSAGLAFWVQFQDALLLTQLQKIADKRGLLIPGICLYQNRITTALRLGFAHLNQREMEESVRLLYEAFCEVVGAPD